MAHKSAVCRLYVHWSANLSSLASLATGLRSIFWDHFNIGEATTTMVYTHVLNQGLKGVRNPMDKISNERYGISLNAPLRAPCSVEVVVSELITEAFSRCLLEFYTRNRDIMLIGMLIVRQPNACVLFESDSSPIVRPQHRAGIITKGNEPCRSTFTHPSKEKSRDPL